jgi:multidrug efflux pump subunit AcrB
MRISDFAVRNYPFTIVVFVMMIALGVSALRDIARTEDPYFPISAFMINVVYPGADPIEAERQIVKPIEDMVHSLDDVKDIESEADDSFGAVRVEFQAWVDVDKKYDELTRELNALRPSLPAGVTSLDVQKINPGLVNIVQYALVSPTASYAALEDAAKSLRDALERVPGVRKSETWAYPRRELRIALDFKRMAQAHVSIEQMLDAVQGGSANVPGGPVEVGGRRFNVKTTGAYANLDQVRDTVIGGGGRHALRLRDVAEVSWSGGAEDYTARYNGVRAVWVTAQQKDAQNIFETKAAIDAAVAEYEKGMPADIRIEQGFDQSQNVAHRLNRLTNDLGIAIALVLITLLPLGLRAAGIVMISIPLSLATGLAVLYHAGFSLNQLSIAGFVVALGLLVDDTIVVTENIARFLRLGYTRTDAAMQATRQIALAVLGCTGTLLFAFLPLLKLPGNPGKFIQPLPVAVVATVLASLFVSLTIIPFLASRLLSREEKAEGNRVLQTIMHGIHTLYAPALRRALARPLTTLLLAAVFVGASLLLVPLLGFSLFPKADTPQALVDVILPNGAGLMQTDAVLRRVEAELRSHPEVKNVMANLGRGNPQVYYNVFQAEYAANYASVFFTLKDYDSRKTPRFFDALRARFNEVPGAEILVKEFENGPPIVAPIEIRVIGPDLGELHRLAAELEATIASVPGTRNVRNPLRHNRIDLKLDVDRQKAGLLGVAPLSLDRAVRLALAGLPAGDFHDSRGEAYPIVLRAPMQARATPELLRDLHVANAVGTLIPLDQLATLKLTASPTGIEHYGRERSVGISAFVQTGYNTAAVTKAILRRLAKMELPRGYRFQIDGEAKSAAESFAGFGTAILIAAFGIVAVLVLEFGSFLSTLIAATVVPLGAAGGLLMLFLSGYSLSFTAMIGFIALIGIEIKNSILFVDFTNRLRREGVAVDEAIERAGEIRFLPILLTSATAIGGLLPLALQNSGLYSPMAWVIIGGLIASTLLGRLVTPVAYKLLTPRLPGGTEGGGSAH